MSINKRVIEEIKAYRDVTGQLEAKLATKERTAEIAREFAGYCRKVSDAFDTIDIPFERKVQMLSAVRVEVLTQHSISKLNSRLECPYRNILHLKIDLEAELFPVRLSSKPISPLSFR